MLSVHMQTIYCKIVLLSMYEKNIKRRDTGTPLKWHHTNRYLKFAANEPLRTLAREKM